MGLEKRHPCDGQMLTIREASVIYKLPVTTIEGRMHSLALTLEEAVHYGPKNRGGRKAKPKVEKVKEEWTGGRKPFRKLIEAEIAQHKARACRKCKYHGGGIGKDDHWVYGVYCDYLSRAGHRRPARDPRDCELWREP